MAEKKYSLTKPESDRLSNLLNVAMLQEEILNAVKESYRFFMVGTVFERLKLDAKLFKNCAVDLRTGELLIREPDKPSEKPPAKTQVVEAKGEAKNAN